MVAFCFFIIINAISLITAISTPFIQYHHLCESQGNSKVFSRTDGERKAQRGKRTGQVQRAAEQIPPAPCSMSVGPFGYLSG